MKIPRLGTANGKVVIDSNDAEQVKWFEEFRRGKLEDSLKEIEMIQAGKLPKKNS